MSRIAILTHQHDDFYGKTYFLKEISELWKENGHAIEVLTGTARTIEADLAILHLDMTEIPDEYLRFAQTSFPRVINGSVKDISKRIISSHICHAGEAVIGPVIVKTNLNCGGIPEALIRRKCHKITTKIQEKLKKIFSLKSRWSKLTEIRSKDYPVFESIEEVPADVWANPNLIVERFIPERKDELYCLRIWTFLGDSETHTLALSKHKVLKSHTIIHREKLNERVPDELRERRRALGFDFGKFDYVMADSNAVLLDTNRTPTLGLYSKQDAMPGLLNLASGIDSFL